MYGTGEGRIISVWAYTPRSRNELNEFLDTLKDAAEEAGWERGQKDTTCMCVKDLDFRDTSWKTSISAMLRCCKKTGEYDQEGWRDGNG